jgi:prevent-host-death family protein
MKKVGTFEAKTRLSELLDQVAKGEIITITKHGIPVAELRPVSGLARQNIPAVIERIRQVRQGNRLNGLSLRALIEEGRR